jgi:dTDP-4-amino-4,6-dideoxy-D-galactose acyltransferase
MKNFQKLHWDSELFGYGVAKITSGSLNVAELNKVLAELRKNEIKLAYWSTDPKDRKSNNAAIANEGLLVDTKTTYLRRLLSTDTLLDMTDSVISYLNKNVNNKVLSLALESGLYSRFRLDPHFKNNEFENLYKMWIENSLNGKIAKDVLVYCENDEELGLITLGTKDKRGDIGLLAVDESARGKSIGKILMHAAFEKFKELGFKKIQVVTQKSNTGACKFYEKLEFEKEKEENIYHFWL